MVQDWATMGELPKKEWMESVQLVFDYFCERTPRSFVEARDTSVVWNYKYAGHCIPVLVMPLHMLMLALLVMLLVMVMLMPLVYLRSRILAAAVAAAAVLDSNSSVV